MAMRPLVLRPRWQKTKLQLEHARPSARERMYDSRWDRERRTFPGGPSDLLLRLRRRRRHRRSRPAAWRQSCRLPRQDALAANDAAVPLAEDCET
jgi:hypothetical protein